MTDFKNIARSLRWLPVVQDTWYTKDRVMVQVRNPIARDGYQPVGDLADYCGFCPWQTDYVTHLDNKIRQWFRHVGIKATVHVLPCGHVAITAP